MDGWMDVGWMVGESGIKANSAQFSRSLAVKEVMGTKNIALLSNSMGLHKTTKLMLIDVVKSDRSSLVST